MNLSRNRLYTIVFIACLMGYAWLFFTWNKLDSINPAFEVCIIKQVTNIPCPSCGSTRSVLSLFKGQFVDALKINPLGFIVASIMLLAPVWIVIDMISKRKTMMAFYIKIEYYLKRPQYAIPLVLLVVLNWIWNIIKGL